MAREEIPKKLRDFTLLDQLQSDEKKTKQNIGNISIQF